MKTSRTESKPNTTFAWVAGVYLAAVFTAVAYAWGTGVHLFDLSLTVSLYVGLFKWTSTLYFFAAAVICVLLGRYVAQTKLRPMQKLLYGAILLCVFGCAWFPCNGDRSELVRDIHDGFSYVLVILVALSFGLMALLARNHVQRRFGLGSLVFSVFFILAFALKLSWFKDTIFIWENGIIALLFLELLLERQPSAK